MALASDLRVALRSLARRPAWTAAVIGTLSIGLAGAIAVGSVVDGVLLRPLPYAEPGRIVRLYEQDARGHRMRFADPNFLDLAEHRDAFAALAEYDGGLVPVVLAGDPQRIGVAQVSRDFFSIFGVEPRVGRLFSSEERTQGGPAAALISERLWRDRFGANADLASIHVSSAGAAYSVVGVVPASFDFPPGTGFWIARERDPFLQSRTAHNYAVAGRLADGVPASTAARRADEVAANLTRAFGEKTDMRSVAVVPLLDSLVAGIRPALLLEAGAAAFLLLVAGVNAAALSFARLESRRREIATRLALGARAAELARFFLADALLVVAAAGVVGTALAEWSLSALRALAPPTLPRLEAVRIDGRVAVFAAALVVATTVALALAATAAARRIDVEAALREGAPGAGGGRRRRLRFAAVATQAGITLVLLVGLALLGSSLGRLLAVAPGFRPEGLTALDLFPTDSADSPDAKSRRAAALESLLDRARQLPGAREAGLVSTLPLVGDPANGTFLEIASGKLPASMEEFARAAATGTPSAEAFGRMAQDFEGLMTSGAPRGDALYLVASEGYFRAMGIPLLAGRLFRSGDSIDAAHVAVVSKTLADRMWPGQDPLGRRLEFGNMDGDPRLLTIVGVVGDVRQTTLAEPVASIIYTCFRQRPQGAYQLSLVVAPSNPGAPLAGPLRQAALELFPDAPARLHALESLVAESTAERRLVLELLGVFAGAALALAAAGVFGAVSLAVAERRREYGIRMALGADGDGVARLAVLCGLKPVVIGGAVGLLVAILATRALAGLLYEIRPSHPPAYLIAAAAIMVVAFVAALFPARRAARIDPAVALRAE